MIRLFVYGTLKPGEINHPMCERWVVATQAAIAYGLLYQLPMGYPALTTGDQPIQGVLLSCRDASILPVLDAFEQHDPAVLRRYVPEADARQNNYDRQSIEVFDLEGRSLGEAWMYRMSDEQVQRLGGVLLPTESWHSK